MADYPIINAPSNLTAEVVNGTVSLTWSDNSDNETDFNVRFSDPTTGAIVKTWHAEENATGVAVPIVSASQTYGIAPGTYDITVYAVGYFTASQPDDPPSTNLWSGPSNPVRLEVTQGGGQGKGHGKGGNPHKSLHHR